MLQRILILLKKLLFYFYKTKYWVISNGIPIQVLPDDPLGVLSAWGQNIIIEPSLAATPAKIKVKILKHLISDLRHEVDYKIKYAIYKEQYI